MKLRFAAAALVVSLFAASRGEAQVVVSSDSWFGNAPFATGPVYTTSPYGLIPYSYYAAIPFPARGYVGYGYNDFPYYGRPYGSPSDPWSWAYMSTAPNAGLVRYYYPPVR